MNQSICPKCGGKTLSVTEEGGTAIWCVGGSKNKEICNYSEVIRNNKNDDDTIKVYDPFDW